MDLIQECHRMARMVAKSLINEANDEEVNEVKSWLQDEKNAGIYNKISSSSVSESNIYHQVNSELAWKSFKRKYMRRDIIIKRWISVAASVLIMASALTHLVMNDFYMQEEHAIKPGGSKAMLILSDGSNVNLEQINDTTISEFNSTKIITSDNLIKYAPIKSLAIKEVDKYNTLIVPAGGEFNLQLDDGSIIWLNSKSKLRYPVQFGSEDRKVYLEGEAYCEIAKDAKRPFIVELTNNVSVEVLGTKFNVKSYNNEEQIYTVLEEGSVEMRHEGAENSSNVVLKPGFMGTYEKKNEFIKVEEVDVYSWVAWKDKQLVYDDLSLKDVMKSLSRWYDVEVVFVDEDIKDMTYTLDLRRYSEINVVLGAIEATGEIEFEIKKNKVYVRRKK
ncbi:MAG: FecR domain-containing protein [Carboxylicivirga sp.]|nr:FecR domain-containing protein [Carboxylicivirga sp.]